GRGFADSAPATQPKPPGNSATDHLATKRMPAGPEMGVTPRRSEPSRGARSGSSAVAAEHEGGPRGRGAAAGALGRADDPPRRDAGGGELVGARGQALGVAEHGELGLP